MNNNLMKNLSVVISILAIIIAGFSLFKIQQASELVYVDINKLLEGYTRTKIMRAEFQAKAKTLNANVDSLVTGWQKELKEYEKERSNMTKRETELKLELLSNKQQQVNNYQQAVQKQIQDEDKKISQTVINDINDYVKDYGKKHSYRIIFGAGGTGNIMYAEEGSDLTNEILKGLNEEFEEK